MADRVPGSSTKSMIGHPQGASGAAGVVASALALSRGFLPPTINLHDQTRRAISTSFPTTGEPRVPRPRCATASGLARRTARSCSAATMDDVAIVGGGPAGSLAARSAGPRRCARPRLRSGDLSATQIVWRHPQPWRRGHPRAALGHRLAAGQGLPIDGMLLTGPGGVRVRGRYRSGQTGCAITRRVLDAWLVDQVRSAGVHVDEGARVNGLSERSGSRRRV